MLGAAGRIPVSGSKMIWVGSQNNKTKMESTMRRMKVTVQGVNSPVPAVLRSEQAGSRPSISNDCNDTMVAHLSNVSDNATSGNEILMRNPFQRGSKLVRTPEKATPTRTVARSRSSPPVLNEDTPTTKPARDYRECMSELGEKINKLIELTRLPQRSINKSMRDLLNNILRLHTCAQEEFTKLRKAASIVPKIIAEATPKRLRGEEDMQRKTPPKRSKTFQGKQGQEDGKLALEAKNKSPTKIAKDEAKRDEKWVTVARKKRRKTSQTKTKKKTNAKPPPRPDAIVITKNGDMSYSDILRTVKRDESLQQLGENVSRIKKTAKGEILLELKRTITGRASEYKDGIGKLLGEKAEVRTLTQEMEIEIRDLDEITTKDDIAEAIRLHIPELNGFNQSSIKILRPSYAGTQTAVISLPVLEARKLSEAGKIKIGWVVCRIREKLSLRKCFRCLEYGHMARVCKNAEDRSECCLKCGEKGHFAKSCKREPCCIACKKNDKDHTNHQMGSRRCPIYQAAFKIMRK